MTSRSSTLYHLSYLFKFLYFLEIFLEHSFLPLLSAIAAQLEILYSHYPGTFYLWSPGLRLLLWKCFLIHFRLLPHFKKIHPRVIFQELWEISFSVSKYLEMSESSSCSMSSPTTLLVNLSCIAG